MANQRRGGLEGVKDTLQANRFKLFYILALCTLGVALAEYSLLPDRVGLRFSGGQLSNFVEKNTAILAHVAISLGFGAAFCKWPREIVYLVGSVLGIIVALGVLVTNLGLV